MATDTLVLGCGYTGRAVARAAHEAGLEVVATVRSAERARDLGDEPFTVVQADALTAEEVARHVGASTHVVVCFQPDGATDARIAPALAGAGSIAYVSTTGVYGDRTGRIDDETPLGEGQSQGATLALAAEATHRAIGGTVLRCPGIYGPDRGLHLRVVSGQHRIPGDGSRTLSRIHVVDLAAFLLAARGVRGETFVVGDLSPEPHVDVVRWICTTYGVPFPPSVPLESVHDTLRANRAIDGRRAIERLGVALAFPTYRDGMSPAATGLSSAHLSR